MSSVHHPKVYVVQEPRQFNRDSGAMERTLDLSPAEQYGELVFLFSGTRQPHDQQAVVAAFEDALKDFTESDFILPTGAPALIMCAAVIAAKRTGGLIQLLEWERRMSRYRLVRYNFGDATPARKTA